MANLLLAHDLGTSGNKATLFDAEGNLLKNYTVSYETHYSHDTWAEQNPLDWWKAVCESTRVILSSYNAEDIACITFSGQMMGCLPVDAQGIPLRNHILYCDQRAIEQIEALIKYIDIQDVYAITGHRADPSYTLAKLMWVRDHENELYRNTAKVLQAKDYINYRLTGRMVTDYNDASGTNALDLQACEWSDAILDAARIEKEKFPLLVSSTEIIGTVTSQAAEETGLRKGTPVVAGAGDGGCATVGIGSVRPTVTYNYLGSSSWISTTSETPIFDPNMKNFTWKHPIMAYFQPCGTMQTAGSSYAWVKKELGGLEVLEAEKVSLSPYQLLDKLVDRSPVGAHNLLFLPYLLGERSPRWNPRAKGAFIGLTLERTRADMVRSVLEGITMNLRLILDTLKVHVPISEMRLIGGGAKGRQWRQIMADIYDMPILVPTYLEEATSMGAAVIGGVGIGLLPSFDSVERFIRFVDRVCPIAEHTKIYRNLFPLFDEAYEDLVPLFDKL